MQDSPWIAGADCPECGGEVAPGAPVCATCGFELVEAPGRALPRPSARVLAAVAAGTLALLAAVLIATRDQEPEPPSPVSAAAAETRLEARLTSFQDDDTASVRCPAPIRTGRTTRCQVRYARGGVQPILVGLRPSGRLDVDIP